MKPYILLWTYSLLLHSFCNSQKDGEKLSNDFFLSFDDFSSPPGFEMIKVGSPELVSGVEGQAIQVTSDTRQAVLFKAPAGSPSSCVFDPAMCEGGFSLQFWVLVNSVTEDDTGHLVQHDNFLTIQFSAGLLNVTYRHSLQTHNIVVPLLVSRWTHILISMDTKQLSLVMDGIVAGRRPVAMPTSVDVTAPPPARMITIGGFSESSNLRFNIDSYRFSSPAILHSTDAIYHLSLTADLAPNDLLKELKIDQITDKKNLPKGSLRGLHFTPESSPIKLSPNDSVVGWCLDRFASCNKGFYVSFWFKYREELSASHTQNIVTSNFLNIRLVKTTILEAILSDQMNKLSLDYNLADNKDTWSLIEVTWHPKTGLILLVNEVAVVKDNRMAAENTEFSLLHSSSGPVLIGPSERDSICNFDIAEFEVRTADRPSLIRLGRMIPDAPEVLRVTFDSPPQSSIHYAALIPVLYGNASYTKDGHANTTAVHVPSSTIPLSGVSLGDIMGCLGRVSLCSDGFTLRFWLRPEASHLFGKSTMGHFVSTRSYTVASTKEGFLLVQIVANDRAWTSSDKYKVKWNEWQFVEATWSETEGLGVYVDGNKIDILASSQPIAKGTIMSKDLSLWLGRGLNGDQMNSTVGASFDDLELWTGHRDVLYALNLIGRYAGVPVKVLTERLMPKVRKQAPKFTLFKDDFDKKMQKDSKPQEQLVESLRFNGNNYIVYKFQGLLATDSETEQLEINFKMDSGSTSGLLWYAKTNASYSLVAIRESKLYFIHAKLKDPIGGNTGHMVKEEIFIDLNLAPGLIHKLTIRREGTKVSVRLNDLTHSDSKVFDLPFITPLSIGYLGGSENPSKDTMGVVDRRFKGIIYKTELRGNRHAPFDLVNRLGDPSWGGYFTNRGSVMINRKDAIRNTYDDNKIAMTNQPVPITFVDHQSLIRLTTWDFSYHKNLEIKFSTYEPTGIMFFVGPAEQHKDFVCLEMFDGNVYFVYGMDKNYEHVQMNPIGQPANTGAEHTVFFGQNADQYEIKYDSVTIKLNQKSGLEQTPFQTYTYIGNIDSVDRLPWQVWSRKGFAGCMYYLKVNGDRYIDPAGMNNQHSSALRGIVINQCVVPQKVCQPNLCQGGVCYDRFTPDPNNFDCDCSFSTKTYIMLTDFPRSAKCSAIADIITFRGGSVFVVDFESSPGAKMATHTDDISIQFKTSQADAPIFRTARLNYPQFFDVSLKGGKVVVETNIHESDFGSSVQTIRLDEGAPLNDNQWHTLYLKRRADYFEMWVSRAEDFKKIGTIPKIAGDFSMEMQRIYVGAKDASASEPTFKGQMRNFYWNDHDFFHTKIKDGVYITTLPINEVTKVSYPKFPPNYPTSILIRHQHTTLSSQPKMDSINTVHLAFKTTENGILFQVFDTSKPDSLFVVALILKGQLYVIWVLGNNIDGSRVYTPASLNDDNWHRVLLTLEPSTGGLDVAVDNTAGTFSIQPRVPFYPTSFNVRVGGLTTNNWQNIYRVLNSKESWMDQELKGEQPFFVGCMAQLTFNDLTFASDLFQTLKASMYTVPDSSTIGYGYCTKQARCYPGYCANGGRCSVSSDGTSLICDCSGTGFRGDQCGDRDTCPPNYCANGGICLSTGRGTFTCDCRSTGFTGAQCRDPICSPGFCIQGQCRVDRDRPVCTCPEGYVGDRCDQAVCPPGYCQNRGVCLVRSGYPYCECAGTGFTGPRCTDSACSNNPCQNRGTCRVIAGRATCDCTGTGFRGVICNEPICSTNYCSNGGVCIVQQGSPSCDCSRTNFDGSRCEIGRCPPNYCFNSGSCVVYGASDYRCQCRAGFSGSRCEQEECPPNYCYSGGRCTASGGRYFCSCPMGYTGERCERTPACPNDYCFYGGQCTMENGIPKCLCRPGFYGPQCRNKEICPSGYCQNNGECVVSSSNQPECRCRQGFTGRRCEIVVQEKKCPPNYCVRGQCILDPNGQPRCDCRATGYGGSRCDDKTKGFEVEYDKYGYVIYPLNDEKTHQDDVAVGFQTWMQDGTLYTFVTTDGKYWALKMKNGRIFVDINGVQEYLLPTQINDGQYHVVYIQRSGKGGYIRLDNVDTERFTFEQQIIPPGTAELRYNKIIFGANDKETDIFKGVLGGFNWNGRYLLDDVYDKKITPKKGEINVILTPKIIFPKPELPKTGCSNDFCVRGTCVIVGNKPKCDCWENGYYGDRCEKLPYGVLTECASPNGYVIYDIRPSVPVAEEKFRIMFQTYISSTPLILFKTKEGKSYEIALLNGQLVLYIGGKTYSILSDTERGMYSPLFDGLPHTITMYRNRETFRFTIDGRPGNQQTITGFFLNGQLTNNQILIGVSRDEKSYFCGAIGALDWNKHAIIDQRTGQFNLDTVPINKVIIIQMPTTLTVPISPTEPPKAPLPKWVPDSGAMGGVVWPPMKNKPGEGPAIFVPGVGNGGGAIVIPGAGPVLTSAGFGSMLYGALINPWLAGLLLCLLLLLAALIWACYLCKPGCCPCCRGFLGAGGAGGAAGVKAALFGAPVKTSGASKALLVGAGADNGMLVGAVNNTTVVDYDSRFYNNMNRVSSLHSLPGAGGASRFGTVGYSSNVRKGTRSVTGIPPYSPPGQFATLDINMRDDGMSTMRIDQPIVDDYNRQNVFLSEEMKVDCCIISHNSKYAVTGSSSGPPQVWDMGSGDLFKVMDGMEMGCTDLHLACGDTILVGQVIDDINVGEALTETGPRLKRLQLWDFVTGSQIEMPEDIICSATSLTHDSEHVVAARSDPAATYPTLIVWDLLGNQTARNIPYFPVSPALRDHVSRVHLTPDDRIALGAIWNPAENATHFLIFDLVGHGLSSSAAPISPVLATFSANLDATVIINNQEAVTGTKKGELVVWNVATGKPVRTIMIHAILEGSQVATSIAPHQGEIHSVAMSKDGEYLITGGADQQVKVWTLADDKLMHTMEGHADQVMSVAVSNDNEVVISGSWDGSIRVWRMRDASQMCWFTSNIEILRVHISSDKRAIVALGERAGHRKLIMLQIVRNKTRRTRQRGPPGSAPPFNNTPPY